MTHGISVQFKMDGGKVLVIWQVMRTMSVRSCGAMSDAARIAAPAMAPSTKLLRQRNYEKGVYFRMKDMASVIQDIHKTVA